MYAQGYTPEAMKKQAVPLDRAFLPFSAGNNWIINRFCLEWAEIITQRDDASANQFTRAEGTLSQA
ncbi:hypothetical protein LNP74_30620 [Klebsiella pneumoniae subsp. pneumoniae]|nr:hypothetical protein [Klebsiella pneumoniae subsp. pneumoniae]